MKKPWISEHTAKITKERREVKCKGDRSHCKMQEKEVMKSARHDKNRYLEQKCIELENEGDKALKKSFR